MKLCARLIAALALLALWHPGLTVDAAGSAPAVELSSSSSGPREIEDLTRQKIVRDYAAAWKALELSQEQNRVEPLSEYFTGTAKTEFARSVREQGSAGIHRRYIDHGHKLEALFYAPDGGVMQLQDNAQYEVQIFDGSKLISTEQANARFLVLMTPAADRWMVRLLQNVAAPGNSPPANSQ